MATKAEKTCNNWQLSFMEMVVHKVGIWVKDTKQLLAFVFPYICFECVGIFFHSQFVK